MEKLNKLENFQKNLLNEFRVLYIDEKKELSDEKLVKAITFNENLKTFGYILKPKDIVKIARYSQLDGLYLKFIKFYPNIERLPMYPNFPNQVMEMDESEFRFHQLCHYFSTYGIESITDENVKKGWLPDVKNTSKVKEDKTILSYKIIETVNNNELLKVIIKLFEKTERFTIPEKEIAKYAVSNCFVDFKFNVTFKENLFIIFEDAFNTNLELCELMMKSLCKHSGDVLDFIDYELEVVNAVSKNGKLCNKKNGHFRQSQKNMLTRVLESFGDYDLMENLTLKRNRNLTCLRYLSFNKFSKDDKCKDVVKKFRNKEIRSWYSKVDKLLENYKNKKNNAEDVVKFIGKRQGETLRMLIRLFRIDVNLFYNSINELKNNINKLSLQTLISLMQSFNMSDEELKEKYSDEIEYKKRKIEYSIMTEEIKDLIESKLCSIDTPLKNKKVCLDTSIFDFEHSVIELNDKLDEGGYIRSGLAIKILDDIDSLRFFVYWNDKRRVDVDLHSYGKLKNGYNLHVGWSGDFRNNGISTSGDITHSDAAEYIDIKLKDAINIDYIENCIDIYYGSDSFKDIDTIFTGMMAVSKDGTKDDVKLYNSQNLFFRHDLKNNNSTITYCKIYPNEKYMKLIGSNKNTLYTLNDYLGSLFKSQNVILVDNKDNADIILSLDKQNEENNISLIDENYFMDLD